MTTFERVLTRLMNENGVNQAELSRRSGVSKSSLSRYLAGDDIPVSKAKAIADALGVSVDTLLGVQIELTSDERKLLSLYRAMNDGQREALFSVAQVFVK